jgi:archaetidylinositol phosphate synthase
VISSRIGHSFDPAILKVYHILFMGKALSPNSLTVSGACSAFIASLIIAFDHPIAGAVVLAISGLLDLMDGAVARNTNNVTPFGGFLDSVLDRYSDLLVMCGILVYFVRRHDVFDVLATSVAAIGVAIIPYAKARAEAAHLASNTGLLERPERLFILLCGLFSGFLSYAVVILAVFTHVTVFQRIIHAKKSAEKLHNHRTTP